MPDKPAKLAGKPDKRRNPRFKKTQRRKELDELKRKFQVTPVEAETVQVLLPPSDPDFILPIAVLDFDLSVPAHYPHKGTARIHINNKDIPRGYALNAEQGFLKFEGSLLEKVKELDRELESLLTLPPQQTIKIVKVHKGKGGPPVQEEFLVPDSPSESDSEASIYEDSSDSDSDSSAEDSNSDESDSGDGHIETSTSTTHSGPKPRGTELVLNLQLNGISLLELQSLNVLIKCGRCKFQNEFFNMNSPPYGDEARPRSIACEKCNLPLAVGFRKEYIHAFSNCGGFLDVAGGTLCDMLPSSFIGVCEECNDATFPFKLVDFGKTVTQVCRKCHAKQSMTVESFRFDVISTGTVNADKGVGSNASEKLKIKGGEPLPDDGVCKHYRKSLRWFRFSCCRRVFPCDRCHDEEAGHRAEPAMRMICGKCAKEQHFSPECRYCHHIFTTRRTGFWEGGKGTRDRTKMSRKDPRKYKRRAPKK